MANLYLYTHSDDVVQDLDAETSSGETPEEIMPPPYRWHLPDFEPKILNTRYQKASAKDRTILTTLYEISGNLSTQLQKSKTFELQVRELYKAAGDCTDQEESEDYWTSFFIEPVLKLALELSGLNHTVIILPLRTIHISPESLLPRWKGKPVSKKIDIGLAIKLDDDIISHHIKTIPDPEDGGDGQGIGPASTVDRLGTHPLFCHIEVKRQYQVVDPIVQLGVWTSAVYTRWEQVKNLNKSTRDFPVSFGWTIEGCYWRLYLVRRLPDGSRQMTEGPRVYDTLFLPDIYRLIVTLHWIMKYGQAQFREEFLDSILGIQA